MMRMPFGKYKGYCLDKVPSHYLHWLTAHGLMREPLRSAVLEEVLGRNDHKQQPDGRKCLFLEDEDLQLIDALIKAGHKALTKKAHLAGAAAGDAQRLNQVVKALRDQLNTLLAIHAAGLS